MERDTTRKITYGQRPRHSLGALWAVLWAVLLLLSPLPGHADQTRTCVIEAGRDLNARDIAIQCGTSPAEVAAIRQGQADLLTGQDEMKAMLLQLVQQTDDFARMRAGGVTEANLIALAQRVAEDVTDPGQAFAQLSLFVDIAIDQQRRAREAPGTDAFVDAVVKRVADLSARGDLPGAKAEADRAVALWDAEQDRQRLRGLALLETAKDQDVLNGDYASAADRDLRMFALQNGDEAGPWNIAGIAGIYRAQGLRLGTRSDLEMALALLIRAIERRDETDSPGGILNNLGIAASDLGIRSVGARRTDLLGRAVAAFEEALALQPRTDDPDRWATTHMNLAIALRNMGNDAAGAEGEDLITRSIQSNRAALEVFTREQSPENWAMTQNNLGTGLRTLSLRVPDEDRAALLREAIGAYRASTRVLTREDDPVRWAAVQGNIGIAYENLAALSEGDAANSLLTIAARTYQQVLEVLPRRSQPVQWADTQNNLAVVLLRQSQHSTGQQSSDYREKAMAALERAREIRTRDAHPLQWALIEMNRAVLLADGVRHDASATPEADLRRALGLIDGALDVLDPIHTPFSHGRAEAVRAEILAAIEED